MNILVLNAGSSSLKFQVISTDLEKIQNDEDIRLIRGEVEDIGAEAVVTLHRYRSGQDLHTTHSGQVLQSGLSEQGLREGNEAKRKLTLPLKDLSAAVDYVLQWMTSPNSGLAALRSLADIHAVGHRVVHGGEFFNESVLITDDVIKRIGDCVELAPLHNPINLEGIRAVRDRLGPKIPQVAVFDTAFHHSLPEHAYLYAIPYDFYGRHRIRRYGFHGISHRYIAHRYRTIRNLSSEETNFVSLHLGNGCSAAAIRAGRSVDTSMGMTPLEGLVMGTRSGDLDPSILGFIAEKQGISLREVETLLNEKSGLLGISGITRDMRVLQNEAREHDNRRAEIAIDIFCYRARKYIGAFLAAMGGADAVVFTGGIGENSPQARAQICAGLEWAGLSLDPDKNERTIGAEEQISREGCRLVAYVIPTDEELLIARDTAQCVLTQLHPK